MIQTSHRNRRWLAAWIAAAGCGLWLFAQAVPADAQAARTRPGGGGSSSSASSGGGSSSSSASSGGSSSSGSSGPVRVSRTRPSGGSSTGSPTVVEKRRPGRPHGGGGGFIHPGGGWYGYPYGWGPYGWSWWLGWGWDYPYWGYPYGYPPYGGGGVYSRGGPELGALDTDVWPARTQIWIDGRYVGFVDQFDGWPRYLWLEKGTYDVSFYLEGYKTLSRQYTIYPGLVIDVEDRLEPGESIHPTELAPKETPHRDARVQAERERAAGSEPEWQERVRADRESARPPDADAQVEAGRLMLAVHPADAAVYLDGDFVGTGGEVSGRRSGLAVSPGSHQLSVVRPGYAPRDLDFEVDAGGEVSLTVDLEQRG